MQKLAIYQSLWAMERRHPDQVEYSVDESFDMIVEAGFSGVCLDLGADEIAEFAGFKPLFETRGLTCMVNAFPGKVADMQPLLGMAGDFDATLVNVIGGVIPVTVAGAIPVIYRWMEEAEKCDLPLLFETHRDGMLNDLYYTLQVIDSVPEMRLCADLSHFVVDREFRIPLPEVDRGYITRILERSDCFQGRVASREQVQIQIDFPQHAQWVEVFKSWWKEGMRMWRSRNVDDATLIFLCELGPPPYAMTDANQLELSDRWTEGLAIKTWVEQIWAELEQEQT